MRKPSEDKKLVDKSQYSISHYYSEVQKGWTDILYFFTSYLSETELGWTKY